MDFPSLVLGFIVIAFERKQGPSILRARGLRQRIPSSPSTLSTIFFRWPPRRAYCSPSMLDWCASRPLFTLTMGHHCWPGATNLSKSEATELSLESFRAFGDATGLLTNLSKSEAFRIQCTEEQVAAVLAIFPVKRGGCSPLHQSWPPTRPL
jgi:hypothetical protein